MTVLRRHSDLFLAAAAIIAAASLLGAGAPPLPLLLAAVLLLGLPHGALDLWIAGRAGAGARGWLRFHLGYLGIAGVVVSTFLLVPVAATAAFLAFSVWHFADDWRGSPACLAQPHRIALASAVVLAPLAFHPSETLALLAEVAAREPPAWPGTALRAIALAVPLVAVLAALRSHRRAGAEGLAVIALACTLPPLGFFASYFVLLHGPRHVLRHAPSLPAGAGPRAALYAGVAIALVLVLGSALGAGAATEGLAVRSIFVGLAALSVPHALLVEVARGHDAAPARLAEARA